MQLFKYLCPARIDVLKNKKICFSSAANVNDPFELSPILKLYDSKTALREYATKNIDQILREQLGTTYDIIKSSSQENINKLKNDFIEKLPEMFDSYEPNLQREFNNATHKYIGILSLTEVKDDILMWSHYTDAHQGFVIEFDPESEFFNGKRSENDEFRYLRPVEYSKFRPNISLLNVENMSALITKSDHWSYEKEWRMMASLEDANQIIETNTQRFHLFNFPPSAIKSLTFGCRILESTRNDIYQILSEDAHLRGIPIFQAEPDSEQYRLNINKVHGTAYS